MGWLFSERWPTQADMVKHLASDERIYRHADPKDTTSPKQYAKVLAHCTRGKIVWIVWELPWELVNNKPVTLIECVMINNQKNYGEVWWGYKDMDETVHPFYYSCPLSYLEIANNPPDSQDSRNWREALRKQDEEKKEKRKNKPTYNVGDVLIFEKPIWYGASRGYIFDFEVLSKKPLRFDGKGLGRCRMTKNAFDSSKFQVISADEYRKIRDERAAFRKEESEKLSNKKLVLA